VVAPLANGLHHLPSLSLELQHFCIFMLEQLKHSNSNDLTCKNQKN
jgi:hypothetical protein